MHTECASILPLLTELTCYPLLGGEMRHVSQLLFITIIGGFVVRSANRAMIAGEQQHLTRKVRPEKVWKQLGPQHPQGPSERLQSHS